MSSKAKFLQVAEAAGCDVEYVQGHGSVWCVLWAPSDKHFVSSACACDASFNQMTTATGATIDWVRACAALEKVLGLGFQSAHG